MICKTNVVHNVDVLLMSTYFLMLIIIGILSVTLSLFVRKALEKGMIFHWYYKILDKLDDRGVWYKEILKPLGLCVYCYSTWLYIILHLFFLRVDVFLLCGIGINYVILELIMKKIDG